jgi:MFS family permease
MFGSVQRLKCPESSSSGLSVIADCPENTVPLTSKLAVQQSPRFMPTIPIHQLFAHTSFVRYFWSRLLGVTGNQMLMVAVAWHMYDLTSSAWDLGLAGLFQFMPALLLTLPAGQVADRMHRARIFAACLLLQALVALVLIGAAAQGWADRNFILAVSVVLGVCRAFQMPAQQALAPLLVPPHLLQRALALSSSGMQVAIICGPALGGALYLGSHLTVYVVCAGLLLMGSALAVAIRYPHHRKDRAEGWSGLCDGLVFVWQNKLLLGVTSLDLFAVLLGGAVALLPIFARDVLQVGPVGLGLLRSSPAAGALLASIVLVRWPLRSCVGRGLLMAVGVFGIAIVVFGLSTNVYLSMWALAASGAADSISVVTRSSLIQLETPDALRGRVSAVNSIFIGASNQLGEFESGVTAELLGPVASVVLGGIGTVLVAALWMKLFPSLTQRNTL